MKLHEKERKKERKRLWFIRSYNDRTNALVLI
jgi:hypothetical protein